MSKITFRADEELVERLERFDASKSEVMRRALRAYLDDQDQPDPAAREPTTDVEGALDALIAERVDELLAERLGGGGRDLDLTISIEGAGDTTVNDGRPRKTTVRESPHRERSPRGPGDGDAGDASADGSDERSCGQCGSTLAADHVYCPNCGEKATRRVFCECGDEIRSDWAFCPSCGRRTPAADVLDGS